MTEHVSLRTRAKNTPFENTFFRKLRTYPAMLEVWHVYGYACNYGYGIFSMIDITNVES